MISMSRKYAGLTDLCDYPDGEAGQTLSFSVVYKGYTPLFLWKAKGKLTHRASKIGNSILVLIVHKQFENPF